MQSKIYKIAAIAIAATIVISCSQSPKKQYTIGVSQCSDDEWRRQQNLEMQQAASILQNMEIRIKTSVDNTEQQKKDIEDFIKQKVDMLIVSPNEAAPLTSIIKNAFLKGIPVVLIDRKIITDHYTAYIGADNEKIGENVGEYVARILRGAGNVVEIMGLKGSTPAQERHKGFVKVLKNYPNIKILETVEGDWLKNTAQQQMQNVLKRNSKIDLLFAQNDRMADGAYQAASQVNRENGIKFIGIDALPGAGNGIDMVLQRHLSATFAYPTGGDKIIALAQSILQKDSFARNNILETFVVNTLNAHILDLQTKQITEKENRIAQLNERIGGYEQKRITNRNITIIIASALIVFAALLILMLLAYRSRRKKITLLGERNSVIDKQRIALQEQKDELTEANKLLQQQTEQLIEQREGLVKLSKELESSTQDKLVFFTNISHEFRTPLTLIAGPVNSLLQNGSVKTEDKKLLILIEKNVKILLKLIDQIIDFRKYENGKMNLSPRYDDLSSRFLEWGEAFAELAQKKKIRFSSEVLTSSDWRILFDVEKLERVYFNLLSNAIKFTPEKGTINVTLEKAISTLHHNAEETFIIKVSNSGSTIKKDDLKHLFDRFYQVDETRGGSGIGLALTKQMVELHNGEISVTSENNITTFTVIIPIKESDLQPQQEIQETDTYGLYTIQKEEQPDNTMFDMPVSEDKDTILVIDDNADIRSYIKSILYPDYNVLEAKDGQDGFQKAVKYVPDLIVSDVMMPPPDGFELTKMLKGELSTSHIPIILLTAYSLDNQRIQGLESGADDFVAKPFNSEVFYTRIKNMIATRKKLRKIFDVFSASGNGKNKILPTNQSFVEKVKSLIEKRIDDTDLDVDWLARQVNLSVTQLYRKLKSLTGYSPVELKRIIRLDKAHALLGSTELNISEIAYETGFSSPAYFTKCYREYYGESPTDYLKRIKGN
jgi:signal transduction histidine kinase/DNA-binding response OmpR family regulator/ABC-type xylose transport system substrate-binding protein